MGFTLRIINPPTGTYWWIGDFAEKSFDYDPVAGSGGLRVSEVWDYPSDPRGCTTLRIQCFDVEERLLLMVSNLGPVNNGQEYEFNFTTRTLTVITVEPPPVVTLPFIGNIFTFVWDIADFFLSAYQEVSGWWWPFHLLQYPLYGLYRVFKSMLTPIADFWLWAEAVATKIVQIFSLDQITAYFRTWIDAAINAWNWVANSFWNVWNIVESWWSSAKFTVLGWIDMATQGFDALIVWWDEFWKITWPKWMATLEVLGSNVQDFFTHTLPTLFDISFAWEWWGGRLKEVQELIASNLKEWFPFYDDIAEFFSDPGEFLLSKLTDWFLGKEK